MMPIARAEGENNVAMRRKCCLDVTRTPPSGRRHAVHAGKPDYEWRWTASMRQVPDVLVAPKPYNRNVTGTVPPDVRLGMLTD